MNIAKLRKEKGLLQSDLAKMLSIDRSTVAKWETGEAMPRADKLVAIADALHCTVDELFANTA